MKDPCSSPTHLERAGARNRIRLTGQLVRSMAVDLRSFHATGTAGVTWSPVRRVDSDSRPVTRLGCARPGLHAWWCAAAGGLRDQTQSYGGSRTFSATDTDYEIATGAAKNLCFSLGARRCGIPDHAERCAIALVYVRRAKAAPAEPLKRMYQTKSKPMLTR
jgi:hypothetical protein